MDLFVIGSMFFGTTTYAILESKKINNITINVNSILSRGQISFIIGIVAGSTIGLGYIVKQILSD